MRYSDEQLQELAENMDLNDCIPNVLRVLWEAGEEGMIIKDIGEKTNLRVYVRDKAILTLEFAGLITKKDHKGSKIYWATEEGIRIKKFMEGKR